MNDPLRYTRHRRGALLRNGVLALSVASVAGTGAPALGQTGRVSGTVFDAASTTPVPQVQVAVEGTAIGTVTNQNGAFNLANVPAGPQTLLLTVLGYATARRTVTVHRAQITNLNVPLTPGFVELDEVVVIAGSRTPGRIVEAPAAVSVIPQEEIMREASHGQLPRLLLNEPGVDIAQSDLQDFNVNARGFNSSLNRRVLVLQDGMDRSLGVLQSQEWWALSRSLDDIGRIEMVRGPGSALYGPNAFSGVINITSPAPAEVAGTSLAVSGGTPEYGRIDARHAGVTGDGRWGYKANLGYQSAWDTFSRSRIRSNAHGSCAAPARECTFEYGPLPVEDVPFDGGPASVLAGSARLDRNFEGGSVLTMEAGATRVRNQILVVDFGRVQGGADRPWARLQYTRPGWKAMAWYAGRYNDENTLLTGGTTTSIRDDLFHVEAQGNWSTADERLRAVGGASNRWISVDTRPKLAAPEEHPSDTITSAYGQVEYRLHPQVQAFLAGRFDHFTVIHADRLSPKAALVFSPSRDHSVRLTYNRAYQTPNYVELFALIDIAPPVPLDELERGLEQQISQTIGRPVDLPLDFGPTPFRGRGNDALSVEQLSGYEAGYKGAFLDGRVFATLDVFYNQIEDFITDLLPRVNPSFRPYELPPAFETPELAPFAQVVLDALRNDPQLGPIFPLLAMLPDGRLEYVLSFANAGRVNERGLEAGLTFLPAPRWEVSANYTYFGFGIDEATVAPGDRLLPNTPKHKANLGITYDHPGRFDVGVRVHAQQAFDWAAGGFAGRVPGYALVDLFAGWHWNKRTRFSLAWTNVLDRDHYEMYGGSVLGSRAIVSAILTF